MNKDTRAPRDDGAPGSFDSILAALNTIAECFASDGGIILNAPPAGPDRDQAIADIRWLVAHLPSLIADSALLDEISKPGAMTRVYHMATENRGDPPMVKRAAVSVPFGTGSTAHCERATLRSAIRAAVRATPHGSE